MGGRPPFIRDVKHNPHVKENTPFTIHLEADWPTPSWTHEITTIDVLEKEMTVIVNYEGIRNPGVAMQVIKSFSTEIELVLPKRGSWTILVKGRSEDWESKILVN